MLIQREYDNLKS